MKISIREIVAMGALAGVGALVSANASSGRELIISAPVEQIDRSADTVTVLGQSFHAQADQLNVAEIVNIYGVLGKDGTISDVVVQGTNRFGTNGDRIFLKGVVTGSDPALGRAQVGGMSVDYTSQLADNNFVIPDIGDAIAVSGSQPAIKGVLVASATGADAYAAESTVGAAASLAGIVGPTAGIGGDGTATGTSAGSGIQKSEITGSGTSEITGSGTAEITGSGTAEITGSGVAAASTSTGRR